MNEQPVTADPKPSALLQIVRLSQDASVRADQIAYAGVRRGSARVIVKLVSGDEFLIDCGDEASAHTEQARIVAAWKAALGAAQP